MISSRMAPALIVAALCTACQPGLSTRPEAEPGKLESRAAQLDERGENAAAARAWEEAAAGAPQPRANRLWLSAARAWLAAGDAAAAAAALGRLAEPVSAADSRERIRLRAELAIGARQPQLALTMLEAPGLSQDAAALATRARAQFALGEPADAVVTLVARSKLLQGRSDRLANERMIVAGVAASAGRGANLRPPPGTGPVVAGWLELGLIEADAAVSMAVTASQLQAWRLRYPAHPANRELWQEMSDRLGRGVETSSRIALLLPLSGRARGAGVAVQDGFLSAYYQQPLGTRPQVDVYDVAGSDAPSAYLAAVAGGAQVVVGPLTREEVASLATMADGRVTTLALNFLPENTVTPRRFYQFALSPEDEARLAARRAVADGRPGGVALAPATEWGQRVLAAFTEELAGAGGILLARSVYAPGTTDFNDIITQLLDLRPVRTADDRPSKVYRTDAQFIFVAAQPVYGRLIRTQLRFNYAGQLPMYSTSDVYDPGSRGNNDLDGVIFPDMPWVIDAGGPVAALRDSMNPTWQEGGRSRSRLYAFGYDAFTVAAELGRQQAPFATPLAGITGRLSLDAQGRIHRDLQFAQVEAGNAAPLPDGPVTPP